MKRILPLFLALAMALSLSIPALAVTAEEAQSSAVLLHNLNLFRGVGVNDDGSVDFDLNRAPTRAEAVTMLVRLLGAEDEAAARSWSTPFTDVPNWVKPYVGYAYNKGLTKGIGGNLFGSNKPVTAAEYLTFLLRALDYQDGTDFTWNTPWTLTDKLGVTAGEYGSQSQFLRADAVVVSENALFAEKKGAGQTLLEALAAEGAIKDSSVVIWDYGTMVFEKDFASFLFYPVKGSPATFQSFKLDRVTVNGLGCKTLQVTNPKDVAAYLASIGHESGGFGYVEVTYDQAAALAAADQTYTDTSGNTYPLLGFTFTYTATQEDGTKVTGTFTDYYYIDNRD